MMKRNLLFGLLLTMVVFAGCKKESAEPDPDPVLDPQKELLLKDSTYYYSLLFSLWTDKFPEPVMKNNQEMDLRKFTDDLENSEAVLTKLKQYAPQDRFSFVDRTGQVSEEIQQGVYKETGILPIFLLSGGQGNMYIRLVQKNSPAQKAGLKRGMQILSINGDTKVDYNSETANDFKNYNKFFTGETLSLRVKDPVDNKESTISVTGGAYQIDPILVDKVVDHNGKKVGYIAYTSFVNVLTNNLPNAYHQALTSVFDEFQSENIEELVIDLRYNGGGATNSAELIANLIAPVAAAKDKMYDYKVNQYLEEFGWTDNTDENAPFKSVNFNKTNSLNLKRVYFLVTKSTASASELVINVLSPYMDTQIISTNGVGSYGKPVGFFGWPVVNDYADLYITSFQMVNKNGYGDYYDGLVGTKKDAQENFLMELGDVREGLFAEALYSIANNGQYRSTSSAESVKRAKLQKEDLQELKSPAVRDYRNSMFKFSKENHPKFQF